MAESTLPWMEPCGHAEPQAASQLHGVCIFCYRDRLAAAYAAVAEVQAQLDAERKAHAETRADRDALIGHFVLYHPMPWTIELDWTVEVNDAKGVTVIKFNNGDQAKRFIALSEREAERGRVALAEIEAELAASTRAKGDG